MAEYVFYNPGTPRVLSRYCLYYTFFQTVSIFLGLSYQKLTPLIGWRNTLRITSLYVLALGLPLSFFVKLKSIDAADSNVGLGEQSVVQTPENQVVSSITDKYQTNERESENKAKEESEEKTKKKETAPRQLHSWLRFLKDYKVWCVAVAFYFPAMTWSVYWVNIVSNRSYYSFICQSNPETRFISLSESVELRT